MIDFVRLLTPRPRPSICMLAATFFLFIYITNTRIVVSNAIECIWNGYFHCFHYNVTILHLEDVPLARTISIQNWPQLPTGGGVIPCIAIVVAQAYRSNWICMASVSVIIENDIISVCISIYMYIRTDTHNVLDFSVSLSVRDIYFAYPSIIVVVGWCSKLCNFHRKKNPKEWTWLTWSKQTVS